jgi:hypothetical protein
LLLFLYTATLTTATTAITPAPPTPAITATNQVGNPFLSCVAVGSTAPGASVTVTDLDVVTPVILSGRVMLKLARKEGSNNSVLLDSSFKMLLKLLSSCVPS